MRGTSVWCLGGSFSLEAFLHIFFFQNAPVFWPNWTELCCSGTPGQMMMLTRLSEQRWEIAEGGGGKPVYLQSTPGRHLILDFPFSIWRQGVTSAATSQTLELFYANSNTLKCNYGKQSKCSNSWLFFLFLFFVLNLPHKNGHGMICNHSKQKINSVNIISTANMQVTVYSLQLLTRLPEKTPTV